MAYQRESELYFHHTDELLNLQRVNVPNYSLVDHHFETEEERIKWVNDGLDSIEKSIKQ